MSLWGSDLLAARLLPRRTRGTPGHCTLIRRPSPEMGAPQGAAISANQPWLIAQPLGGECGCQEGSTLLAQWGASITLPLWAWVSLATHRCGEGTRLLTLKCTGKRLAAALKESQVAAELQAGFKPGPALSCWGQLSVLPSTKWGYGPLKGWFRRSNMVLGINKWPFFLHSVF